MKKAARVPGSRGLSFRTSKSELSSRAVPGSSRPS
jgi:hypothetical protein